jgi:hypothetical protein
MLLGLRKALLKVLPPGGDVFLKQVVLRLIKDFIDQAADPAGHPDPREDEETATPIT